MKKDKRFQTEVSLQFLTLMKHMSRSVLVSGIIGDLKTGKLHVRLWETSYTVKKIFSRFVITTFFLLSNQLK